MTVAPWSGRRVAQARSYMARKLPAPCGQCGKEVTTSDRWVIGHIVPRSDPQRGAELTWQTSNWRHEHATCSAASAQSVVIEKAKREAYAEMGLRFPEGEAAPASPPLPVSPSGGPGQPFEVREELTWASFVQDAPSWLDDLLQVPDDASPPLAMTPVHPESVGTYGAEACEWIEETQGVRLRWWQRLAIYRQLEHRADGSLVWRTVVESCPRRAGKSVRIRGMALWRLSHAAVIGEVQTVVHCGNDLPICREVQRGAWRWAETEGWTVTRANGKEAIESDDGSRWVVRSQDGAYGWDAGLAVVDEGWDVKPDTVSEGLEPAMLERLWAQLHLTSTAHRRATSLMPTHIAAALADDDGETLLLLWAARPDADAGDPATWRAASPHWSEDRARMIASKYAKALAGEADPEADDLDPMQGFTSQYLNVWRLGSKSQAKGDALLDDDAFEALRAACPDKVPGAIAVESSFGDGLSVALAWRTTGEVAVVSVLDCPDLGTAAEMIREVGYRGEVIVGASLADDPAFEGLRIKSMTGRTSAVVQDLARLLAEQRLTFAEDDDEHLAGQLLGVRTLPGPDGPRLVSRGRSDALKAVSWAVSGLRSKRVGKPRIITAKAS